MMRTKAAAMLVVLTVGRTAAAIETRVEGCAGLDRDDVSARLAAELPSARAPAVPVAAVSFRCDGGRMTVRALGDGGAVLAERVLAEPPPSRVRAQLAAFAAAETIADVAPSPPRDASPPRPPIGVALGAGATASAAGPTALFLAARVGPWLDDTYQPALDVGLAAWRASTVDGDVRGTELRLGASLARVLLRSGRATLLARGGAHALLLRIEGLPSTGLVSRSERGVGADIDLDAELAIALGGGVSLAADVGLAYRFPPLRGTVPGASDVRFDGLAPAAALFGSYAF